MSGVTFKYVCQSCGYESPRWVGKCPSCSEWNTFVEEPRIRERVSSARRKESSREAAIPLSKVDRLEESRISTGIVEFDRVLGGGIVPGSVVLVGGDPGIGKSTLMMQMVSRFSGGVSLYVTGEESVKQIKLRSDRLKFTSTEKVLLLAETNIELVQTVIDREKPDLVIIDSIQTMYRPELESAPGSVSQVRETTAMFMRTAKTIGIPIFVVGHVTKEGVIAGPKVVEHMVDTVLQFEGERHHAFRILRAVKNRFGSTNEIGIFEMRETGLEEIKNPSEVFLSERSYGSSGSTVVASMEGTRPILVEVQALVTQTNYGVPQRNSTGIDYRRLSLLLAVLEKRVGLQLGSCDVFVNIAGGVHIDEPAVDLGIATSIASSLRDIPVDSLSVAVGEIGLAGEIRTVGQIEKRVLEARKLGFQRIIVPKNNVKGLKVNNGISVVGVDRIEQAMEELLTR
ncbi:MAG TPA: DNA repair protein RadA [Bacteroidota bacterium]